MVRLQFDKADQDFWHLQDVHENDLISMLRIWCAFEMDAKSKRIITLRNIITRIQRRRAEHEAKTGGIYRWRI